jgi:uncharacterized protein YndB with AHSA1/START domain
MTQTDTDLDRIERSIEIDASAERVWSLLERPGWWINEHDVEPDTETRDEGDGVTLVTHEKWGEFRIATLEADPPRYLKYRWIEPDRDGAGTDVEFWVTDRPGGGVTLRVLESGLTSLGKTHDELVKYHQGNSEGWEAELAAASRFVLGTPA